jgi:hypothetical protein
MSERLAGQRSGPDPDLIITFQAAELVNMVFVHKPAIRESPTTPQLADQNRPVRKTSYHFKIVELGVGAMAVDADEFVVCVPRRAREPATAIVFAFSVLKDKRSRTAQMKGDFNR